MLPTTMGSLIRPGERQTRHTTLCVPQACKKKKKKATTLEVSGHQHSSLPLPLCNMTALSWSRGHRSDLSTKKQDVMECPPMFLIPLRRVAF